MIQNQGRFVPQVTEVIVKLQMKDISDKMMHIWDFQMSTLQKLRQSKEKKADFQRRGRKQLKLFMFYIQFTPTMIVNHAD